MPFGSCDIRSQISLVSLVEGRYLRHQIYSLDEQGLEISISPFSLETCEIWDSEMHFYVA